MSSINSTAVDLLKLTLLSIYIIFANACWMPFFSRFPQKVMLFIQFFLIAIPQSMIVIFPEHSNKQYSFFSVFGSLGALFSYLRYDPNFSIKPSLIFLLDLNLLKVTLKPKLNLILMQSSPRRAIF